MAMPVNTQETALISLIREYALLETHTLNHLIEKSKQCQQSLFPLIVQNRLIDPTLFAQTCEKYFQLPFKNRGIDLSPPLDIFSREIYKNHFAIPITADENNLTIGISNPVDKDIIQLLSFQIKKTLHLVLLRYDVLLQFYNRHISSCIYNDKATSVKIFAEQLLSDAIHRYASDIHLETFDNYFRVRFRLDGLLHTITECEKNKGEGILNCLKVLAHVDIAIKRMPQEGKLIFHTSLGFYKDCRISTCPTVAGEKMVIRLLDQPIHIFGIDELGLSDDQQQTILHYLKKPQGLILVTGPTGSGKTITLYSLLNILNQPHRNIVTIEDPVEIQMEGINQTSINNKIGLTFSHTLRALLRQDPDIIMLGEIRDEETAEMAIRAALTGHLVLSTLHTNSASEALTRLSHMGFSAHALKSAISLVIAQRLVRKICGYCQANLALNCTHCYQGFLGRMGVFELLPHDDNINNRHDSLRDSALKAVVSGKTTQQEMDRVIV